MEILIPAQRLGVLAETDVLVCGGGTAGVAAAIAARRHGARVLLLERWPSVGGMLTNALVNIWHVTDRRKQVIFGLVQEAIERGGEWATRFDRFPTLAESHWWDPEGARITLHRMLDEAGVRTICGLMAVQTIVEEGCIRGVLVDTKTGRKAVLAKIVIDATGDGDIAANAGLPFVYGREADGLVQGMTMIFLPKGQDNVAMLAQAPERLERTMALMRRLRDEGRFPPFNEPAAGHLLRHAYVGGGWNMCPATGSALDEEDLTRAGVQARERVVAYLELWRKEAVGFADAHLDRTGFSIGIRESRRIAGLKILDAAMVVGAVKQPDAIGHGFWMVDIHDPRGSGHSTFYDPGQRRRPPDGESYHIPLGMCLNRAIPNLAVVGRCASSTHEAHASVRLQTHCMVMGQGVGTAAALALERGVGLPDVPLPELQARLRRDGVYIEDVPGA